MKSIALSEFPSIWMTLFALLIFVGVFCGVLVWISFRENRVVYEKLSQLPFEEET